WNQEPTPGTVSHGGVRQGFHLRRSEGRFVYFESAATGHRPFASFSALAESISDSNNGPKKAPRLSPMPSRPKALYSSETEDAMRRKSNVDPNCPRLRTYGVQHAVGPLDVFLARRIQGPINHSVSFL